MTTAPFALLVESPTPPVDRTPTFTYDRSRQLNVTLRGDAVVDVAEEHDAQAVKKDGGFTNALGMLFGPSYTHNAQGHKKDDD
ncbi:hypothetical protein ABZ725_41915 [Streptomyces sp. NPDC006872]|uniref:hypothetical protein n=1 Tax=Streptomyces sp. NPDC006872 TaxID=3155720 RepID=UPI0033E85BA0